jgi:uncharacterized repeat protein (TIGR02543 family)
VAANGDANTTTTALIFVFSKAVAGLAAENIILTNGTGNVTKGALTGGGNTWTLALVVNTAGNITAAIAQEGIEAGEKTVGVRKAAGSWTVIFDGDGGIPAEQRRTVSKGGTVGAGNMPAEPDKSGHAFRGWYTERNGGGDTFAASTTVSGDMTVYAQWEKEPEPEPDIPAFSPALEDVDFATFQIMGHLLSSAPTFAETGYDKGYASDVRTNFKTHLAKIYTQSGKLRNGYNKVKEVYPQLNGVNGIVAGENTIRNQVGSCTDAVTYLNKADNYMDAILDSILGNDGAERSGFDKYYNAYKAGEYYKQKQRDKNNYSQAFTDALEQTDIQGDVGNVDQVLAQLKAQMLAKIIAAMGIDGTVTNTTNLARINELNTNLITQIQDISQYKAVMDDVIDLGYSTDFAIQGPIATTSQSQSENKASHLTSAGDFIPEFLKPENKGKGGVEIA